MHICKFQYGFGKKKEKFLWTRLWREGSEGSEGKVLKMDRPAAGGFLSLTALRAEGCGIALAGDEHYNAAFRRSRPHRVS